VRRCTRQKGALDEKLVLALMEAGRANVPSTLKDVRVQMGREFVARVCASDICGEYFSKS